MADLKKSDVSGTVGAPDTFKTLTVGVGHTTKELDVHESDSIEEITEAIEGYLHNFAGIFDDADRSEATFSI
jgi:hypothetical protein